MSNEKLIPKLIFHGRMVDVFITGPIQILVGYYTKNILLKWFMYITGISSILFNLSNYLYLKQKIIKQPFIFYRNLVHPKYGKLQIHRLYNIFVMYPIFIYLYFTQPLPDLLKMLFFIEIVLGLSINWSMFDKIRKKNKNIEKI